MPFEVIVETEGHDDRLVAIDAGTSVGDLRATIGEYLGHSVAQRDWEITVDGEPLKDNVVLADAGHTRIGVAPTPAGAARAKLRAYGYAIPVGDAEFLAVMSGLREDDDEPRRHDVLRLMIAAESISRGAVIRAICTAVSRGDPLGCVPPLLEAGVPADIRCPSGDTLLMIATKHGAGDHSLPAQLLRHGADVGAHNLITTATPLHAAAKYGHASLIDLFVKEYNAPVHAVMAPHASTPLHVAAEYAREDVCARLLDLDADMAIYDDVGRTPVHIAAKCASLPLLQLFVKHAAVGEAEAEAAAAGDAGQHIPPRRTRQWVVNHANPRTDMTPLLYAAEVGCRDACRWLVEDEGADVTAMCRRRVTALHYAAGCGDVDLARMLVKGGAAVAACDSSDETPLIYASLRGHDALCRMLLESYPEARAAVDWKNADGTTALLIAAQCGHETLCHTLVEHGADVNASDPQRWTPLMWAAAGGMQSVCGALLRRGVQVNTKNNFGNTPLSFACDQGLEEVCAQLLARGADANAANEDGWSPLMWAAEKGHLGLCRVLLRGGANVNAVALDGTTAFSLSIMGAHADLARELVRNGAEDAGDVLSGTVGFGARAPFRAALDCKTMAQRAMRAAADNGAGDPTTTTPHEHPIVTPPVLPLSSPRR